MFQTMKNAWKVPELRKKLLFTLFIIIIFRIGSAITVPYLDVEVVKTWMDTAATDGNFLEYLNILTGGALAVGSALTGFGAGGKISSMSSTRSCLSIRRRSASLFQ